MGKHDIAEVRFKHTGKPALLFIAAIASGKGSARALGDWKLNVTTVAEGVERLDRREKA